MLYTKLVIPVIDAALVKPIVRTYSLFMTHSMKPNTCSTRQRMAYDRGGRGPKEKGIVRTIWLLEWEQTCIAIRKDDVLI